MSDSQQIFQTNNPTRWQRLKWGSRIFVFLIILAIVIIGITLRSISTSSDKIPIETRAIKKVLLNNVSTYKDSELGKDFKGFKKYINGQWAVGKGCGQKDSTLNLSESELFSDSLGIRAAFYMPWDPQSFFSLKKNISKVNLVLPEWFFIDPKADTLIVNIDKQAYDIIKFARVKMMPILSNSYNSNSTDDALMRIISSPAKKERLISDLLKQLNRLKFV